MAAGVWGVAGNTPVTCRNNKQLFKLSQNQMEGEKSQKKSATKEKIIVNIALFM